MRYEPCIQKFERARFALAISVLFACSVSQATPSLEADAFVVADHKGYYDEKYSEKVSALSSSMAYGKTGYSLNSFARATFGINKVLSSARTFVPGPNIPPGHGRSTGAAAGFTDDITLTAYDGVTGIEIDHGKWVDYSYGIVMRQAQSASSSGLPMASEATIGYDTTVKTLGTVEQDDNFSYDIWAGSSPDYTHTYTDKGFTYTSHLKAPLEFYIGVARVQMGVPFSLSMYSYSSAFSIPEVANSALADASHSMYWGGTQSVTLDGIKLKNYSVTSASGTDYTRSMAPPSAVPEPASITLFLTGLVFLYYMYTKKLPTG